MNGKDSGQANQPPRLDPWERVLAGVISVAAGVAGYVLLQDPPDKRQAAAECTNPDCILVVDGDVQSIVVALFAIAAAAAFLGILGIRFTKISAAGAALESATVSEVDEESAEKSTGGALEDATAAAVGAGPLDTGEWGKLPDWAQRALVAWAEDGSVVTRPMRHAVVSAAKGEGQGNYPWFVKVLLDNDESRVLRVATGRGGTTAVEAE